MLYTIATLAVAHLRSTASGHLTWASWWSCVARVWPTGVLVDTNQKPPHHLLFLFFFFFFVRTKFTFTDTKKAQVQPPRTPQTPRHLRALSSRADCYSFASRKHGTLQRSNGFFFFESCVPLTAWFVYNVTVHLVHFGRGAHGNQEKLAAKLDLYEKKIKMKKKKKKKTCLNLAKTVKKPLTCLQN